MYILDWLVDMENFFWIESHNSKRIVGWDKNSILFYFIYI